MKSGHSFFRARENNSLPGLGFCSEEALQFPSGMEHFFLYHVYKENIKLAGNFNFALAEGTTAKVAPQ